jgi:hypothetical protein
MDLSCQGLLLVLLLLLGVGFPPAWVLTLRLV